MNYVEDLNILRDLYYHLSEKRMFFEYDYYNNNDDNNRKIIKDYIKDYCEKRGLLNKYHYLVDHIWLLHNVCLHGRDIQQDADKELGLSGGDIWLRRVLENWNTVDKEYVAIFWDKTWEQSKIKEKFIQKYGKELIDGIIKEVKIINQKRETK